MTTNYELDTVPAGCLVPGDTIVQPVTDELLTIASARRSRRPKDDRFNQWIMLTFTDGRSVEVHRGDLLDRSNPS
jgi:hypothetical protein